jgi:hypothetical protein
VPALRKTFLTLPQAADTLWCPDSVKQLTVRHVLRPWVHEKNKLLLEKNRRNS